MNSVGESLMVAVKARLTSPDLGWSSSVRRAHRTAVPRDQAPMVHLIDGADTPARATSDCKTDRKKEFTISIFTRDDGGAAEADLLIVEINARLDPLNEAFDPYPRGAVLYQLAIVPDEEIADLDATRINMNFLFEYSTQGWTLE